MAQQSLATPAESVSRGASIAASAGLGVLAAIVGYLITYVMVVDQVREGFGDYVAEWTGVAWYYYNAHLVDVEASGGIGGFSGTDTVDFIAQTDATNATALYVVPPLVLFAFGAVLAYQLDARNLGEAVIVGAPVTIGYAIIMALGAVVAESSAEATFLGIEATGTMSPELVPAIILGGIIYPVVFATAGAVVAALLRA
ncbi:hypothetical protein [Natrialba sp. SSL1]|uniref:hypothetical protein n=1 Tax=Natrialba sp. SSL1 TaxID=1869245 RepID=UPI0008F96DB5|nr:hypothetical protein [Natrialba sp. SSL1]OIB58212.1 hypothetical protein BBD46_09720 [Natrialba sp. SSL1]